MTTTQAVAVFLYSLAGVFAIFGPGIGAVRLIAKYRASKSELVGTWSDPALDPDEIRAAALRDAGFGVLEFGLVALGVVLASIASIILVVPA